MKRIVKVAGIVVLILVSVSVVGNTIMRDNAKSAYNDSCVTDTRGVERCGDKAYAWCHEPHRPTQANHWCAKLQALKEETK